MTGQRLSDIQNGIGAGAHDTLDAEHLISDTRTVLVGTLPLCGFDGEVFPVSEVHNLLTKIHDILENTVSTLVCNTACILAYIFKFWFQAVF